MAAEQTSVAPGSSLGQGSAPHGIQRKTILLAGWESSSSAAINTPYILRQTPQELPLSILFLLFLIPKMCPASHRTTVAIRKIAVDDRT